MLFFGCVLGMFFDQTLNFHQQFQAYQERPLLRQILVFFEIGDVFHSWWFSIVVLLLALNLIACSIERLPPIWMDIRNPSKNIDDKKFLQLPNRLSFQCLSMSDAQNKIKEILPKKYEVFSSTEQNSQVTLYFWEKQKWGRLGVYIIHTALLLVMFGSMATTNAGVDGFMTIPEGRGEKYVQIKGPGGLLANAPLSFEVVCRDFRLRTFVDGTPMAFESDLEIWDKNASANPVIKKTIKVNEPLDYQGYTFYQASYMPWKGEEKIQVAIGSHNEEKLLFSARLGDKIVMKNGAYFALNEVYDNYGGLGEALKVSSKNQHGEETSFVVFRQYPEFDRQVRRGEFDVSFLGIDQTFATGLSVGKVPGINAVFFGFVLLFIGLFMAFALRHRRYYLRMVSSSENNVRLDFGAIALRHERKFKDEFENYTKKFKVE